MLQVADVHTVLLKLAQQHGENIKPEGSDLSCMLYQLAREVDVFLKPVGGVPWEGNLLKWANHFVHGLSSVLFGWQLLISNVYCSPT